MAAKTMSTQKRAIILLAIVALFLVIYFLP